MPNVARASAASVIIIGGDALALSTAHEICAGDDCRVSVLWVANSEFADAVEAVGAVFIAGRPERRESLEAAGVKHAQAILALSNDDQLNLHAALEARDANPEIRIVLRQFNRALAAKIEQNLPDCSVLSLAWHSAATYAAVALDPSCFRGLQFPERNGPLTGFAIRSADDRRTAERTIGEAERAVGVRIIAVDGDTSIGIDDRIRPGARLVVYGPLHRLLETTPRQAEVEREAAAARRGTRIDWRWLRRIDKYLAVIAGAFLVLFGLSTWHFRDAFRTDWLTAAYFVLSTMTTTGYGDMTPDRSSTVDLAASMVLMMLGTIFTGVFTAFLTASLTRSQWVRIQGLRPIRRSGHIVVCGCGSIGAGVVDLLLAFKKPLVVVERHPDAALVEHARDLGFELLTGDASRDDTLDLCKLGAAHSLVALTNIDTLNLEVALGARARNPDMPIVLRIAEATFAASIARHFQFDTTFSVAAMAGPVFAGLSRRPGERGRLAFDGQEFGISERPMPRDLSGEWRDGTIVLAAEHDGGLRLVREASEIQPGVLTLALVPLTPVAAAHDPLAAVAELRL